MNVKYYISISELFKNIGSLKVIWLEMLSIAVSNVVTVDSLFYNLSTNYFTTISDGIILVYFVYQYFI